MPSESTTADNTSQNGIAMVKEEEIDELELSEEEKTSSDASPTLQGASSSDPAPFLEPQNPKSSGNARISQATPSKRKAAFLQDELPGPSTPQMLSKKTKPNPRMFASTPFKSPLLVPNAKTPFKTPSLRPTQNPSSSVGPSSTSTPQHKQVSRLRSVTNLKQSPSKPFKSPLLKSSASAKAPSSATASRRIADMERKLQLLKQAQRIQKDTSKNSADNLRASISQWKQVSRDAAEEIWELIKDNNGSWGSGSTDEFPNDDKHSPFGNNSFYRDNSGFDTLPRDSENYEGDPDPSPPSPSVLKVMATRRIDGPTKLRTTSRFSSYPYISDHPAPEDGSGHEGDSESRGRLAESRAEEESDAKSWTLSTMLTTLGIPPDSLGWNEEEGEFMDT